MTPHYPLPSTHHSQPLTTHYPLPSTHHSQPLTTHYPLPSTHHSQPLTTQYPLPSTHYPSRSISLSTALCCLSYQLLSQGLRPSLVARLPEVALLVNNSGHLSRGQSGSGSCLTASACYSQLLRCSSLTGEWGPHEHILTPAAGIWSPMQPLPLPEGRCVVSENPGMSTTSGPASGYLSSREGSNFQYFSPQSLKGLFARHRLAERIDDVNGEVMILTLE